MHVTHRFSDHPAFSVTSTVENYITDSPRINLLLRGAPSLDNHGVPADTIKATLTYRQAAEVRKEISDWLDSRPAELTND